MTLNLAGVAFAIAAIVLYSINMAQIYLWWMCDRYSYYNTPSPSLQKDIVVEKCLEGKALILVSIKNGI